MNIVVLMGSPNKNGSTAILVREFMRGAQQAGHTVTVVDAVHLDIHPCTGCVACGYGSSPCAQKDDMERVRPLILGTDMLVFATPLYYFGFSAQLKAVIDRFCAFNGELNAGHKKSALLSVAWNGATETFSALEAHYKTLVGYLNLQDCGAIFGLGCGSPAMTERTKYPRLAYELGKGV